MSDTPKIEDWILLAANEIRANEVREGTVHVFAAAAVIARHYAEAKKAEAARQASETDKHCQEWREGLRDK